MESDRPRSQNEILAAALRLIRLYRRMKPAEVAEAMGMAKRSYEHFEAGKGKINLERCHACRGLDGDRVTGDWTARRTSVCEAPQRSGGPQERLSCFARKAVRAGKKVERTVAPSRPGFGQIRPFERPRRLARQRETLASRDANAPWRYTR